MPYLVAVSLIGCGLFEKDADEPLRCRLVGPGEISFENPQISLTLSDPAAWVFATSTGRVSGVVTDAVETAWNTRLDPAGSLDGLRIFTTALLPVGPIKIWARRNETVQCGSLFVSPATDEVNALPEASGVELRAVAGDTDGDGDPDIVLSNGYLLENDGTAAFRPRRLFDQTTDRVALVNLDGTHEFDVVAWNRRGGGAISKGTVLLSDGAGGYTERLDLKTAFLTGSYGDAALGDLDGDSLADAVTVSENGLWKRANLGGTFGSPQLLDAGLGREIRGFAPSKSDYVAAVKIADLNADGHADVAYGRIVIALGDAGGRFSLKSRLYSLNAECSALLGDTACPKIVDYFAIDGGYLMPVAFGINVYFNESLDIKESALQGSWFAEGDFDGDTDPDLIGFGESALNGIGRLTARPGGAAFVTPFFPRPTAGNISAVLIGDFDGKTEGTEVVAVSGHRQITVYRHF